MKRGTLQKMPSWHIPVDEYLVFEEFSNVRHEFYFGDIRAMAGGTVEHGRLAMAFGAQLIAQLRGRRCTVLSSDVRVRACDEVITYPDASVVCGEAEMDPKDRLAVLNPIVLVEVTSPSSEEYDRGGKFDAYQQIASLREYVLVSQREPLVEVWRRADDGDWYEAQRAGAGERGELMSIQCTIDVDELYRNN